MRLPTIVLLALGASACAAVPPPVAPPPSAAALARVYYWKAKAGKLEEYTRYIRTHAEPIDEAARRQGAFLSVTTFVRANEGGPWTHMRVFLLRDRAQFDALPQALTAAGARLQPDSLQRQAWARYSATLRDGAGEDTLEILR